MITYVCFGFRRWFYPLHLNSRFGSLETLFLSTKNPVKEEPYQGKSKDCFQTIGKVLVGVTLSRGNSGENTVRFWENKGTFAKNWVCWRGDGGELEF